MVTRPELEKEKDFKHKLMIYDMILGDGTFLTKSIGSDSPNSHNAWNTLFKKR